MKKIKLPKIGTLIQGIINTSIVKIVKKPYKERGYMMTKVKYMERAAGRTFKETKRVFIIFV